MAKQQPRQHGRKQHGRAEQQRAFAKMGAVRHALNPEKNVARKRRAHRRRAGKLSRRPLAKLRQRKRQKQQGGANHARADKACGGQFLQRGFGNEPAAGGE